MTAPVPPRTIVFIDFSNIYLGAKYYHGGLKIDMLKLLEFVGRGRLVTAVHYFSGADPLNAGQSHFHDFLSRNGYVVHLRDLEVRERLYKCGLCRKEFEASCPHCGATNKPPPHKSKMVDIEIARYLLTLSRNYEEALLLSGDKDFLPVVEWLRNESGKKVSIMAWRDAFSGLFHGKVDEITFLDNHVNDLERT